MTRPSWPASGSSAGAGAAGVVARGSAAGAAAGPAGPGLTLSAPPLTILTFSSPSVISSSAMPDSCTRSMSFLSLRRSIELPQGMGEREVVAAAAQAADGADRQVGEIGTMAERLARLHVGKMHFDERNADCRHRVP